jgi:methanogenic corrinoid protein MtbC1
MLLTTFPSEQHGLGLLLVEAMLVPEGVQCISLGPQTPLEDIRRAAIAHKVREILSS